MTRWIRRIATVGIATALAGGCGEDAPVMPSQGSSLARVGSARIGAEFWRSMTDSAMAVFLDSAGDRVFIGLKLPGQVRGVSVRGERLISRAQEEAFKGHIRGLGVRIRQEYDLPAVLAELPRGLLRQVRSLPFIDYVEPVIGFRPDAQDTTLEIRRVGAQLAWPISDGSGTRILIIDSGRDVAHEDLGGIESHTCVGGSTSDATGH